MGSSILIVDDEPDLPDLFRQRFRREVRQGLYVLHFAASGEEGLNRLVGLGPELDRDPLRHQHAGHGWTGPAA